MKRENEHMEHDELTDDLLEGVAGGFGVEREMKESGEKGGTEDINIGIGELREYSRG